MTSNGSNRLPYLPANVRALIYAKANRQVVKKASSVNAVAREELRKRRANARRKSKAHGMWQGPLYHGDDNWYEDDRHRRMRDQFDVPYQRTLRYPNAAPVQRLRYRYTENFLPGQQKKNYEWNPIQKRWEPGETVRRARENRLAKNAKNRLVRLISDFGRVGPNTSRNAYRRLKHRYRALKGVNWNRSLRKAKRNAKKRLEA